MPFAGKGVIFLEYKTWGWTETYWLIGANYPAARTSLAAIQTATMSCRTSGVKCTGMIVYDAGDPATRTSFVTDPPVLAGTFVPVGGADDRPDLGVLWVTQDPALHRANHYFRGFPSEISSNDDLYVPVPAWETAFNAFLATVSGNATYRHKIAAGPPPVYTFETIANAQNKQFISIRRAGRPFELHRGRRMIV